MTKETIILTLRNQEKCQGILVIQAILMSGFPAIRNILFPNCHTKSED